MLFLIKIIAGLAIGWVSFNNNISNDYWNVNRDGWIEYQLLWNNPKEYFTNLFVSQYSQGYGALFNSLGSFWNDLRTNLLAKFLSLCNFFSRGNYYLNSLIFNFFIFFGHVALYKIFISIYKQKKWLVIIGCFLLPSTLYFTSGLQKDGIVFVTISFICLIVFNWQRFKVINFKLGVLLFLFVLLLFLFRNYALIILAPAIVLWVLVEKYKLPMLRTFFVGYIFILALVYFLGVLFPQNNPLLIVVNKQKDFSTLPIANTQLPLDSLQPNLKSFLINTPQAINHVFFRPYPFEVPSKNLFPVNIELVIYQILFLIFLFKLKKMNWNKLDPFLIFGLFFSISAFLFIGYIIPNWGSIVRYKSIYLPFIITPIICSIGKEKGFL